MSEIIRLIVQARRAGVTLTARGDGKLDWKAAQRPPDALLATLKEHKEDILALLPQPPCASLALERVKQVIWRLQALGFRAYLDDRGVLLIADATARRRDVSRMMPIKEVFDTIVAALDEDPGLLDSYEPPQGERAG